MIIPGVSWEMYEVLAVQGDEELNKLLSCITIAQSGMLSNIH